jgi:ADP-heptose:LPS heptosyltransferase
MERIYRKGSRLPGVDTHVVLDKAGLGDNIARMPAIAGLLNYCPQVKLHLWSYPSFLPLLKYWCEGEPRVRTIGSLDEGKKTEIRKAVFIKRFSDVQEHYSYHKVHMVDHAFQVLVGWQPDEKDRAYPGIEDDCANITHFQLPVDYAVIAIGHKWVNRSYPKGALDKISDYVKSKGLTPVYIGTDSLKDHESVSLDEGDLTKGIDLWNKTTVLEAAAIISRATLMIGMDSGQIHLAGCTKTPIVCGYTVASPETRMPPGKWKEQIDLALGEI